MNLPKATTFRGNCFYYCTSLTSVELPEATDLGDRTFGNCSKLTSIILPSIRVLGDSVIERSPKTIIFGGVGKPISDTSQFNTSAIASSSNTLKITIYVSDSSNPPSLTGSPWGARNATIIYKQA